MAMLTFIRNPPKKKRHLWYFLSLFPITKLSPNLFLFFRRHSEWTFLSCYLFYSLNPQSTTPFSLSSCSVNQSVQSLNHCLTLCDPMDCSMPGFPVHHQLLELAQTHVHWVGYATQPFHPLSFPFPPALSLSQHQGRFQWVSSLHQVAKVLELQHQSFQWIFRTDFLEDWLVWSTCSPRDLQESSPTPQFKSINSSALSFPYGPALTSIHDYWKNHSFE